MRSFPLLSCMFISLLLGTLLRTQAVFSQEAPASFTQFDEAELTVDDRIANGLVRWPTYSTYIKAGPNFSLGDGFFDKDNRLGFSLSGGFREQILPNSGPYFLDVGGSFMTSSGRDSPFTTTATAFDTTNQDLPIGTGTLDVALTDLRRASIHSALGYYFRPLEGASCYDLLFSFRFGGRVGHVNANFEQTPQDDLRTVINNQITTNPDLQLDQINIVGIRDYAETDTFGGIFLGIETVFARQNFMGGDLSLILDTEFANDWINLENVNKAGLPTISFMFGVTMRR